MPHSTDDKSNMAPQVNGDTEPSSAFLSHLYSYPVVYDGITKFKKNPYGAKSIDLTTGLTSITYERLGKPIMPYLQTPYRYVSPVLSKADSTLDSTLSTIDSKIPIIKKPTGELYEDGKSVVFFPLRKSTEGRDYVFKTYDNQLKKVGGDGIITYGKAAIGTSLIVAADSVSWLAGLLSTKKAEAKEVANEKLNK